MKPSGVLSFLSPSAKAGFLTAEELKTAKELSVEHARLVAHHDSLGAGFLQEQFQSAARKYLSNPSDENFEEMKAAALAKKHFGEDSRVRSLANEAFALYFVPALQEWAFPILKRALQLAQDRLERIGEEEDRRHVEAIGKRAARSEIVENARQPVSILTAAISDLDNQRAVGSGNYSPSRVLSLLGYSL